MNAKVYETAFHIGAKFTGQRAFADANRALTRTQTNAAAASRNIGGMFTALKVGLAGVAGYAGYKAFQKVFDIGQKSIEAAKDVRKAHDSIRTTHQKTASLYPKRALDIEKETQATIELAESMEKAGGIDAETFGQSLAKLRKHYSAAEIQKMSKGVQDYLVTMEGGAPTEEAAAARIDRINEFIRTGTKQGFAALNMTKEQAAAFNEYLATLKGVDREEARAAAVAKVLGRETGATAAWKKTDAGHTYDLAQAQEAWFESAGKGSAAAIPDLEKALTNLTVAMEPVAKLINEEMTPHIQTLTTYLNENQDKFVDWGTKAVWAIDYAIEHIERLQHVFWVFDYLIWYGEQMNKFWDAVSGKNAEPQVLQKLPGSPVAPAIEPRKPGEPEGEAMRRQRVALERQQQEAEAQAKSATAVGEGWSAQPPKILKAFKIQEEAAAASEKAPATAPSAASPTSTTTGATAAANGDVAAKLDAKLGGRLKGQGAAIVAAAKKHGVDPYMLAAIAQTESAKGTSYSIRTRNAPVGMMKPSDPSQHQSFVSLEAGIEAGAALLKRGYISQGRTTPAQIGAKWAPPGAANDPNRTNAMWPGLVTKEMERLKAGATPSLKDTVKEMNLQKPSGTAGTSVSATNNITVNGVAPGREALMAKKTALALRDPTAQLLTEIKRARTQEQRLGYV